MAQDPPPSQRYHLASLTDKSTIPRLAAIGVILLGIVACFAYVAGWLSSGRLTQTRIVNAFEQVDGAHPGFRRNHAKGVCVTGVFESNGQGTRLSKAVVFQPGRVPVIGRFAFAGGQPFMADSPKTVRSLALSFRPEHGEEWRTGMIDIAVFPVTNPRDFEEQLLTSQPDPATGQPDPEKMKAFLAAHPETGRALALIGAKPFSSGFANETYNAINTFRFVAADGTSTPVRWSTVAVEPFVAETAEQVATPDKNYLFDALITQIKRQPLQWHLIVTVGQPGDPTNDPTMPWPDSRERVDVGTVTLNHIEGEKPGNCRDITFDPLVLPAGIEPSDDPILSARSATYSKSFTRRAGETKEPSAVQVSGTGKGT